MIKSLLFIAAAALAAQAQPVPVPRGAVVGSSGHATILNVPPAPFVPAEPTPPPALSPDQIKGHDDFRRAGEFQNRVRDEVEALTARLRRAEKGNFVDLYYENEGEPHVVFRFLRAPEATLAKYAAKPYFRAAPARYSNAELRRAMDFMFQTFRDDRIIMSGGVGNKANRAEIEIAITEEEFRELVARKGVRIPEAVVLNFRAKEPASPSIARSPRTSPRWSGYSLGMIVLSGSSTRSTAMPRSCFATDASAHPTKAMRMSFSRWAHSCSSTAKDISLTGRPKGQATRALPRNWSSLGRSAKSPHRRSSNPSMPPAGRERSSS